MRPNLPFLGDATPGTPKTPPQPCSKAVLAALRSAQRRHCAAQRVMVASTA
jgi:hypothetical protein